MFYCAELNKWCKLERVPISVVFHLITTVSPSKGIQKQEGEESKDYLIWGNDQVISIAIILINRVSQLHLNP